MSPEARILQGMAAERLLADETFAAAYNAIEAHYREAVFKAGLTVDEREALFAEHRGFQRVKKVLGLWKSDGLKAADEAKRSEG